MALQINFHLIYLSEDSGMSENRVAELARMKGVCETETSQGSVNPPLPPDKYHSVSGENERLVRL
jgi:hypothetical protein